jgi:probable phosphoglycerate mutase
VSALRLFLLRDGETEWSRERRFTGTHDPALSAAGHRQATAAAAALSAEPLKAVYASPRERTRTAAELIAQPHGLLVTLDARLADMDFGRWQGLTAEEAADATPELYEQWQRAPGGLIAPGGEALTAVAARAREAIDDLQRVHAGAAVAVVTHAVPVRLIVLGALGLDADRLWSVDASPGGLSEIEYRPGWVTVHRMNTLSYLSEAPA